MNRLKALIAVTCIAVTAGCAQGRTADQPHRPQRVLEPAWHDYQALPEHKAMFIAGSPKKNRWVLGMAGGLRSLDAATAAASDECQERRIRQRIQPQCVPYAIGDDVIWRNR